MAGQKRILIIDDDAVFREILSIYMSLAGYAPKVAEDGVEGGKALLELPPDLVLCDLEMPVMNGFEFLSLIRADKRTASIPVIIVSGFRDADTVSKAMKLGAANFLTKPVAREDLLESIRACLAKADR